MTQFYFSVAVVLQHMGSDVTITSGNGTDSTRAMTSKDEMNARIVERQRYLEMLDAKFQLREQQIYLLRQTGQLQKWIQSAANRQPMKPVAVRHEQIYLITLQHLLDARSGRDDR